MFISQLYSLSKKFRWFRWRNTSSDPEASLLRTGGGYPLANKGPNSQSHGLSSSHTRTWELDHKEGWTPKNWCFPIWCWRRRLRVPWTTKRSNQPILKEINPEYSLEGVMLKLKLQHFGHLMRRADSSEKNSDAGEDWRQEEKGTTEDQMVGWHHWYNGHGFEQALGDGEGDREAWHAAVHGMAKSRTWLSDCKTKILAFFLLSLSACAFFHSQTECNLTDSSWIPPKHLSQCLIQSRHSVHACRMAAQKENSSCNVWDALQKGRKSGHREEEQGQGNSWDER